MKSTAIIFCASFTTLVFSAAVDKGHGSILVPRTSAADYVFKDPYSFVGVCKLSGSGNLGYCADPNIDWLVGIPCFNSKCTDNTSPCTIADAADGEMQAKCPTNLLSHDWAWPVIDQDAKTKINAAGTRRIQVEACQKTAMNDLKKANTDSLKVQKATLVYKCFNDKVVTPQGMTGSDAVNSANNLVKSVAACVKTADGMWSKSHTDTDRKNAAVALVACYDSVTWNGESVASEMAGN